MYYDQTNKPHPLIRMSDILIELKLEHDTWQLARALYSDRLTVEDRDEDDLMLGEVVVRTWPLLCNIVYCSCQLELIRLLLITTTPVMLMSDKLRSVPLI